MAYVDTILSTCPYHRTIWLKQTSKASWPVFSSLHTQLIERHCSERGRGIRIECDTFCQSKYGLINELAS